MAVKGGGHIVAAHPLGAKAAVAQSGILLIQTDAVAGSGARGLAMEPPGVAGSGNAFHPLYRLVKGIYDLVAPHDHNHLAGTKHNAGHPVGVAVHIIKHPIGGNGIGRSEIGVTAKGILVALAQRLALQSGPVDILIIPTGEQVDHAHFL